MGYPSVGQRAGNSVWNHVNDLVQSAKGRQFEKNGFSDMEMKILVSEQAKVITALVGEVNRLSPGFLHRELPADVDMSTANLLDVSA